MEEIFDIPIPTGSFIDFLLKAFIVKTKEIRRVIAKNEWAKIEKEWYFVDSLCWNVSINKGIEILRWRFSKEERREYVGSNDHYIGFDKHSEQWIKDFKQEYIRIYNFVHFDPLKNEKDIKKIKEFLGKSIESTENLKSEYDTFVDSINSRFYSLRGQVENQEIETDIRFGNELEKLETQIKVLKQRQWFFLIIIIFVLVLQLHQI
jgi:hypothetical protein